MTEDLEPIADEVFVMMCVFPPKSFNSAYDPINSRASLPLAKNLIGSLPVLLRRTKVLLTPGNTAVPLEHTALNRHCFFLLQPARKNGIWYNEFK